MLLFTQVLFYAYTFLYNYFYYYVCMHGFIKIINYNYSNAMIHSSLLSTENVYNTFYYTYYLFVWLQIIYCIYFNVENNIYF